MNPNETSVYGTRPVFYIGEQVEQPGTSSSNSMESLVPIFLTIPDCQEMFDILLKTDSTENPTLCNGSCPCEQCHIFRDIFQSLPSFPNDWIPCNDIFSSPADPERDHGSSPSTVSPVSTYTCHPTMPSTPEGAMSAIDNNSVNCINVSNPENSVLPAELRKPGCSRTCTGCVRPASACHDAHRLTASEVASRREKFFKGVNKKKKSDKWTCEIRISKKLRLEGSELPAKLWLGTFDTRCQAARALHAGRFLLSEKKKNSATDFTNFEQSSKTILALSEFKDSMSGNPLDVALLQRVKKLVVYYEHWTWHCGRMKFMSDVVTVCEHVTLDNVEEHALVGNISLDLNQVIALPCMRKRGEEGYRDERFIQHFNLARTTSSVNISTPGFKKNTGNHSCSTAAPVCTVKFVKFARSRVSKSVTFV